MELEVDLGFLKFSQRLQHRYSWSMHSFLLLCKELRLTGKKQAYLYLDENLLLSRILRRMHFRFSARWICTHCCHSIVLDPEFCSEPSPLKQNNGAECIHNLKRKKWYNVCMWLLKVCCVVVTAVSQYFMSSQAKEPPEYHSWNEELSF